jgi:tetratricopeptide (TPR) repeat protein
MPTSFSSRFDASLETSLAARLEAFERAWERYQPPATPPRWQDYLPQPGDACPLPFLFWLLATDVESRITAGLPALLAEPYFEDQRIASALEGREVVVELVRREYRFRWRRGEPVRRQQYLERFPQHVKDLEDLLPTLACPCCGQEVRWTTEDAASASCSACGTRVLAPSGTAPPTRLPVGDATAGEAPAVPLTRPPSLTEHADGPLAATSRRPRRLGRYELGEEIAHGGMGAVFHAHDPELHRHLAVKVLRPELRNQPHLLRRFLVEARITGQLQHPGIVAVHDIGRDEHGLPFLVMKLVQGETLAHLLARRKSVADDLPRWLAVFEQVCQAVAFAHSRRVIHRDLKPANVMVGRFQEVQVMDWGLARVLSASGEPDGKGPGDTECQHVETLETGMQTEGTLGSPPYMPPEQATGEWDSVDERADVFALGGILCEILTGEPPYPGKSVADVLARARRGAITDAIIRLDACGVDRELITLARECLSPDIDKRPRDAGIVAERMAAYQRGVQERLRLAEQERAAAQARAVEERKRRRLAMVLAAVVVLLLLAGGSGAWLLQQQRARQAEAGQKATQALDEARSLLEQGWQTNDLATLKAALVEADRASEIARSGGAAGGVQDEATAVQQQVRERLGRAEKNRVLLQELLDVSAPHETSTYRSDASGQVVALVQPSVDEQYAAVFRRRWDDLDIDRTAEAEVIARLGAEPQPVIEEVLASLDAWMMDRRRKKQPEAQWRRLVRIAEQLDHNSRRQQLRALLAGNWQPPLGIVAALTGMSPPWSVLWELEHGDRCRRLGELRAQMNPAREPVLSVVLLARVCWAEGDAAGAERVLRQAVAARPSEVVLLDVLARLLEERGRLPEAIEFYRAGRTLRPGSGVALGTALSKAGRGEEGEAVLRDLIARQPKNPELLFSLGSALGDQKKFTEAEAAFRQAIALKADYALGNYGLGWALQQQKKLADAETAYRQAIAAQPDLARAYINLGNVLRDQKKLTEAVATFRQAITVKPDYAKAYYNLGLVLSDQKKLGDAAAAYRKATDLQADFAAAYTNLGIILAEQKKPLEAEAAFRKVIALEPDEAEGYTNLGTALDDQKKRVEAEDAYHKAIALNPKLPAAHYNLGYNLLDQKKPAEAEVAFRKAVALKPAYARVYHDLAAMYTNRCQTLAEQKKFPEAEETCRKAIALEPNLAEAYNNLGNILRAQAKLAEAEVVYRKAIALKPDLATAYNGLGNVLHSLKKPADAEAAFRKAIALQRDFAAAYNGLGNLLRDQKKLAEAVAAFRKADQLVFYHPIIRNNLRQAERLLELDTKLAAILAGKDRPASPKEAVEFGVIAAYRDHYPAAVRFFADAFKEDPKLGDNLQAQHRYEAAWCAALAAAGKGTDAAALGEPQRAALRQQALDWLRADLKAYSALLEKDRAAAPAVHQRLAHWLADSDLAGVRDRAAVDKLPESERDAWKKLWADVEALHKRSQKRSQEK